MRYKTPVENWLPREQAPGFDRNRYPAPLLARALVAWRRFSVDERDSVIVATLATTDLARLGAPAAILGMAARVIEDQVRHVEVCTRVLEALGADTTITPAGGTRVALSLDEDEEVESRLARALIARFAVGQSL
jgi:hypothetical protein